MPQYRVILKRVTYAEVIVEANSANDAREHVEPEAHDWFMNAQISGTDTTTISSVKIDRNYSGT